MKGPHLPICISEEVVERQLSRIPCNVLTKSLINMRYRFNLYHVQAEPSVERCLPSVICTNLYNAT